MRQKTKTIMKKLLVLLLAIPLIGFSQTETKREYYESGKLLSIINYTDGVRNGSCKYFYDYGAWAIKTAINYKNGKLIGDSKSYAKEGQLIEEGQYKYTEKGVYSRKDGKWTTYYNSGEVKVEITYDDGKSLEYKSLEKDGSITPMPEGGC